MRHNSSPNQVLKDKADKVLAFQPRTYLANVWAKMRESSRARYNFDFEYFVKVKTGAQK